MTNYETQLIHLIEVPLGLWTLSSLNLRHVGRYGEVKFQ